MYVSYKTRKMRPSRVRLKIIKKKNSENSSHLGHFPVKAKKSCPEKNFLCSSPKKFSPRFERTADQSIK